MRPWQFSRPKGPGFGIAKGYYLSVLSSRATLPSLVEMVNPAGAGGAPIGLAAPLVEDKDKDRLQRPIERGAYVVASKDQKTVLRMVVLSKEEAGFDPDAFLRSSYGANASAELQARMRGTWTLAQYLFESHDPAVYPALDFFESVVSRMAVLTEGVIADQISRRYLLPDEFIQPVRMDPRVDAREHVAVEFIQRTQGFHARTLGMQKFSLPEFEIAGLVAEDQQVAARFLLVLCQTVLLGSKVKIGEQFGSRSAPFVVRDGGFDKALWNGEAVLELLPPSSMVPSESLALWLREL